jgi:two-component system, chemotaxis family, protein-glutamate methylesterase/glutaminase
LSAAAKIRVLVVDDSVVVRRMLTSMLSNDAALEVVGSAPNGKIALARIPQYNPDIVVMDVEMPEMDGLQTLGELRKTHRMLPVIMFSTVTERGAAATLDALTLGANDYVTKPSTRDGAAGQIAKVIDELISKIKAHCGPRGQSAAPVFSSPTAVVRSSATPVTAAPTPPPLLAPEPAQPANIVAIGISTGGPNALGALVPTLPANLGVPLLIVQHMPRLFTRLLAERLSEKSKFAITEAKQGDILQPGHGWIAPGDYHMTIKRVGINVIIQTNQDAPENSCRPSVDVLFRSVAQTYGAGALAVIMTGMGQDGLRGCEAIRQCGGRVLAQDEASSVVWGMPGFVARAGLAHRLVPLAELGAAISTRVRHSSTIVPSSPINSMGALS